MCNCVTCPECNGSGNVWISFSGKYLGTHRSDDLDENDECPICNGEGIIQMCRECEIALEEAEMRYEEREREEERLHEERCKY